MEKIPEDLLTRLHQTNERFSDVRKRFVVWSELNFDQRAALSGELAAAQRESDEIAREIDAFLRKY